MSISEETIGTASKFIEHCTSLKSLLCLTSSDDEEGSPIATTESLKRHIPVRCFGILEMIDKETRNFSIRLVNDPRNYPAFKHSLNTFYMDPISRSDVEKNNVNFDYWCLNFF